MNNKVFLLLLSGLLLLLVGPLFGPVPVYLVTIMDVRSAVLWELGLFLIVSGVVFSVLWVWMRRNGRTLADVGWRQPTTWLALIIGAALGLFWGAFGVMGYLQFVPDANVMELSLFRVFTALLGAVVGVLEDMITRGFVMNELKRLGLATWLQVVASSLLFALYHSVWGFNPIGFAFSLIYGLLLAGLFVLGKRSLTPVILGHSLALLLAEPFLTLSLLEAIKTALG